MATQEQIDSFREFASEQVRNGAEALSLGELFDLWEFNNLPRDRRAEDIAAIQASIADMQEGDTGRDVAEVLREVREHLIPSATP